MRYKSDNGIEGDSDNPVKAEMAEAKGRLWQVISLIPEGRVTTYGTLARLIDLPGRSRWVGYLLRTLPHDTSLPWHRVVNASGHIAIRSGEGPSIQKTRLLCEGLSFQNGHINLRQYGWP